MATDLDAVREEIGREHQVIVYPLLDRLIQMSAEVPPDVDYPLAYLREGLELLSRYLANLRDRWVSGVFVRLGARPKRTSPVSEFHQIREEQSVEQDHVVALEDLVEGVRENRFHARWRLEINLRNDALAEKAWAEEEERFARECLPGGTDADTGRSLRDMLELLRPEATALAEAVKSYIARPVHGLPPASPRSTLPAVPKFATSRAVRASAAGEALARCAPGSAMLLLSRPSAFRVGKVTSLSGPL